MPKNYLLYGSERYALAILRPLQDAIRARGDRAAWYFDGPGGEELSADETWLKTVPEVRDFDPASALFGVEEGWEFPLRLIGEAHVRLRESGVLILEIGVGQFSILKEKAAGGPWKSCESAVDYQGIARFAILHK